MKVFVLLGILIGYAIADNLIKSSHHQLVPAPPNLAKGPQHLAHERHPATKSDGDLTMKYYLGCFADQESSRDLPYHLWTRETDNTASSCIQACRHQKFKFAGTQAGADCFCGNDEGRFYGNADNCDITCPGNPTQLCGGPDSNSVYRVSADSTYVGCYEDMADDPEMFLQWTASAGRNAHECFEVCTILSFRYAGVQNGGACYCGDSYGRYGEAEEQRCWSRCKGYAKTYCGGQDANAVYRIRPESDLSLGEMYPATVVAYDGSGQMTGFTTNLYSQYSLLRSIITNKVVIYAAEEVLSPLEDQRCFQNCYTPCEEIYHPAELTHSGETVIVRAFHFNLRDLPNYVGDNTRQVFIYAQTVIIDADLETPYALSVRTRQLLVDQDQVYQISAAESAPDLDQDEDVRIYGPAPDALYLKMAVMCARILLETRENEHVNTAWAIINNVIDSQGADPEVTTYAESIRSFSGELAGLDRADVHFVPFYTKNFLASFLDIYYDRITLYQLEYERMVDATTPGEEYLVRVQNMLNIYLDTDIYNTDLALESTVTALDIANATYMRMLEEYEQSRITLSEAREVFERGLEDTVSQAVRQAYMKFLSRVSQIALGTVTTYDIDLDVEISMKEVGKATVGLAQDMQELSRAVLQINELMSFAEVLLEHMKDINNGFDFSPYIDDLEIMADQQVNIWRWTNLKRNLNRIIDEELGISGALGYRAALLSLCNWGQSLTKAMVEFTEMSRLAMEKRFLLQSKLEMQDRLEVLLGDVQQDLTLRDRLTLSMVGQSYDVRLDLNDALITFCRLYFYENLYECTQQTKPSFGASLAELLLRVNAAKNDGLLASGVPSGVERTVRVTDSDTSPNCEDASFCPLNYFRKYRMLYYQLPTDHPDLVDLDKFRVAEIIMNFEGAKTVSDNKLLRMRIESSGDFQGRSAGVVYNFMTRTLSLAHEYDIDTNMITIMANLYQPFGNIISHMTPYTTWIIYIDESSDDIDFSDLTGITIHLKGGATANNVAEEDQL